MISNYLNTTVTRIAKNGFDVHGVPKEGASTDINARLQASVKRMTNGKGEEFMTDAELWIMPDQDMEIDDQIVFESVTYKVVRVDPKRGLNMAIDHKKCLLVRTQE